MVSPEEHTPDHLTCISERVLSSVEGQWHAPQLRAVRFATAALGIERRCSLQVQRLREALATYSPPRCSVGNSPIVSELSSLLTTEVRPSFGILYSMKCAIGSGID